MRASAFSDRQSDVVSLLLGAGPPDYFMLGSRPITDDGVMMLLLRRVSPEQASQVLQAAVQHGHTGLTQVLQQMGVAVPACQVHGQDLQHEAT
jgi:hypothetical protein